MRKCAKICLIIISLILLTASASLAALHPDDGDRTATAKTCKDCHPENPRQPYQTAGPHGGYQATTDKCTACHTVHKAENPSLLPGTTVVGTCNFCHDLTQTDVAPYYTSYLTTESEIRSAHQVEGLNVTFSDGSTAPLDISDFYQDGSTPRTPGALTIPGGEPTVGGSGSDPGGSKDLDTSKQGKLSGAKFTCDSCHTPHAIEGSTVEPYLGESKLKFEVIDVDGGKAGRFWLSDRLLKVDVNNAGSEYTKYYNSDWCAACHQGRYEMDGAAVHNHPVAMRSQAATDDEIKRTMGYQFLDYANFIRKNKDMLIQEAIDGREAGMYPTYFWSTVSDFVDLGAKGSGLRIFDKDPRTNRQYAMARNPETERDPLSQLPHPDGVLDFDDFGKGPSCQQCHGNARDVEASFDALLNSSNMAFTFPHISRFESLTVENNDDFCTNCHVIDNLP